MRDNAGSWVIKLLLGAIVVVFVLWGVGSNQKSSNPEVANIEGQAISYSEFSKHYQQLVENLRRQFGNNLSEETLKALNLKEQALNDLVDRAVLIREAEAQGYRVSDEELLEYIRSIPAFQSNGRFDRSRYEQMLAQLRMTPESFEASQRDDLLIQKQSDLIARAAKVSQSEAVDWYRWQNASVKLAYVLFEPDQSAVADPGEEALKAYFEQNLDRYKTSPKRSAGYLVFRAADYRDQVRVAAEDVSIYYDEHRDEFAIPESIEARHILFKVDQDADPATVDAVQARAQAVYDQIVAGGDFAALAQAHSEEASTGSKGGYLGTFTRGQMVKPFEEAAFALAPGQVSPPVRTQFGYHIIKVDQKTPAGTRSLAEADSKIRGQLTDRRAQALALEDAETAYDLSYENEDLAAVATQLGRTLQTTGLITRNTPVAGIADATAFGRVLFGLNAGGISEVQEIDGDYYLVQVEAIEESQVPALESVRARVVEDWKQAQGWEQAEVRAKAFLLALKEGSPIEALSAENDLALKTTGFFKSGEAIADIGYQPEMATAAFALTAQDPLPENPIRSNNGFYVFRLLERQEPEGDIEPAQLEQTQAQLLQRKQRQIFEDWMTAARARTEIKIDRAVLQ
jgi:peptidyl-prolyl cis-trans isomerase D